MSQEATDLFSNSKSNSASSTLCLASINLFNSFSFSFSNSEILFSFSICFNFCLYISSAWVANNNALSFSSELLTDELVLLEECVLREGFEDSLGLCGVC